MMPLLAAPSTIIYLTVVSNSLEYFRKIENSPLKWYTNSENSCCHEDDAKYLFKFLHVGGTFIHNFKSVNLVSKTTLGYHLQAR